MEVLFYVLEKIIKKQGLDVLILEIRSKMMTFSSAIKRNDINIEKELMSQNKN